MIAIGNPLLVLRPVDLQLQPDGLTVVVSIRATFSSDSTFTLLPDGRRRKPQDGDVLSLNPDGHMEGRPAGTAGPYELAVKTDKGLVYAPLGAEGNAFLLPYVSDLPNT